MAALLRCPVLARNPRLLRALSTASAEPREPRPQIGARSGSPCPFMALQGGEGPPFVRAPPELQEDVTPPEEDPLQSLLDFGDPSEDPPERRPEENLPADAFPYQSLFGARLAGLRRSHTYREFTELGRSAQHPPSAILGSPPSAVLGSPPSEVSGSPPRLVQVWCSNDYLGMSRHPEVLRAARWAPQK
ncbi:5-aminolevulinate synthase, erythroid-specific, mitochondrial-like [Catharus ustulatus]|uniref:5-aminolevulinate synthase, erythroid-specific, mitochondrial-like n=1 Tax=Catharus ustulatus TaxID=91951 RepID=UPI00140AC043|nr:5-aminolevulinate synthase, erythroid-specific, mitochondrial-like [Catharus ustulatus]